MSNSRNGQRRFLVGTMKAVVLLMCFALIFALVLTVGVMGGGADMGANVADAASSYGSSNPRQITGYNMPSNSEVQTQVHNLFSSNNTSFTIDADLYNINIYNRSKPIISFNK